MTRLVICVFGALWACGKVVAADDDANSSQPADASYVDARLSDARMWDAEVDGAGQSGACSGPTVELADLPDCLVAAQCERLLRCDGGFLDQQHCEERFWDALIQFGPSDDEPTPALFDLLKRAVDAGETKYHPTIAFACLNELRNESCKGPETQISCDAIFRSDVSSGQCGDDFQCAIGEYCASGTSPCAGTCKKASESGAYCDATLPCRPNLHCVYSAGRDNQGVCADGKVDAPCDDHKDCAPQNYCDSSTIGAPPKCRPDNPSGGTCAGDDAVCPGDEVCVEGKCSQVRTLGAACKDTCWGNLYCNQGRCEKLPGADSKCEEAKRCESVELVCSMETGTCATRQERGKACSATAMCELGTYCSTELANLPLGECTERLGDGKRCNQANQCSSGWCDTSRSEPVCGAPMGCWDK